MKRKVKFLFFVLFTFSYMASAQKIITVTLADSNKTIQLSAKQILEVRLPANPTTGYAWILKEDTTPATLIILEEQDFISNQKENILGASGICIIRFKSSGKGISNLQLIYKQPFDKEGEIANHYTIHVNCEGTYKGKRIHKRKNK